MGTPIHVSAMVVVVDYSRMNCQNAVLRLRVSKDIFRRLCEVYKNDAMKNTAANKLRYMSEFVYNFYQLRTTEAVNRLTLLSLVFGGALF